MSRGRSGRIVLEIDTETKDLLYIALAKKKLTLKDWFLSQCKIYISEINQPELFGEIAAEPNPRYMKAGE